MSDTDPGWVPDTDRPKYPANHALAVRKAEREDAAALAADPWGGVEPSPWFDLDDRGALGNLPDGDYKVVEERRRLVVAGKTARFVDEYRVRRIP